MLGARQQFKLKHIVVTLLLVTVVLFGINLFDMGEVDNESKRDSAGRRLLHKQNEANKSQKDKINLNELFHLGKCLLYHSGREIVRIRAQSTDVGDKNNNNSIIFRRKASDNSIVTKADLASNRIIVGTLDKKYGDLLVVHSEEKTDGHDPKFNADNYLKMCDTYAKQPNDVYSDAEELSVYVDPLDATQEYSGTQLNTSFIVVF